MGERVSVGAEVDDAPRRVTPLEYGRLDRFGEYLRGLAPLTQALGGWRQIGFAVGLALLCGGIGSMAGEAMPAVSLWFGGLLIGLSLRLPWLR
jgi:hypothetical protein